MLRNIIVGGATAAVIVGAGTAALAVTGSDTGSATPSAASSSSQTANHGKQGHGKQGKGMKGKRGSRLLRRTEHGEFVVKTRKGPVTHELRKGTVTAVSATSITVQSLDKTSGTFSVTKDTVVRTKSDTKGKPAKSTISKVSKGDMVFVGGIGTGTPVARHVFDRGTK